LLFDLNAEACEDFTKLGDVGQARDAREGQWFIGQEACHHQR